jgi:hypothetical protein
MNIFFRRIAQMTALTSGLIFPVQAAETAPAPGASDPASALNGKVVETMNAASYTYVQLDNGRTKIWAAAPQFSVKVGDRVALGDAMPMTQYYSKTLQRTFDVIYFSSNLRVNGDAPRGAIPAGSAAGAGISTASGELPKGHPAIPNTSATRSAPVAFDLANIKRIEGGQTVVEILTGREKFVGKSIAVRGRVVKFNGGILGKNWLHVRDGSGGEGTNDLTVTTDAVARVGDIVLVTGMLASDRDFGSGYKYALIVENAKIVTE